MILFTADIHIKLGQKNVPVEWSLGRYEQFKNQLVDLCKEKGTLIIGGDTFDRVPTLQELEVYIDLVSALPITTYIFSGNHEATTKYHTFLEKLVVLTKKVNPLVNIIVEPTEYEFGTILPYSSLHKKGIIENLNTSKPLYTHVRGEIPPHVKPEIDLKLLEPFPLVIAGDLHSHSNSQKNIVYPGSPMSTSFHRQPIETGVLDISPREDSWEYKWIKLDLPQLIRKTVKNADEMVATSYDHTVYELEGNMLELSKVKSTELLDKKIVKRSKGNDTFILPRELSIEQELAEYLTYLQGIPPDQVSDIIGLFCDYSKKAKMG